MKKVLFFLPLLFCYLSGITNNYVTADYTNYHQEGSVHFRMWVPPTASKIRGTILIFNQMMNNPALDSSIRMVCILEDLAIVSIFNTTDPATISQGLSGLALASGMPEIEHAPFLTFGHSAAGIFARSFAVSQPDRCFGVIQCNAVDYSSDMGDIPFISVKNEAEPTGDTWIQARNLMLSELRSKGNRASLITQAGGGHFGWTEFGSSLLAMFIQKAAMYQIPYHEHATSGPVTLIRVPEDQGWLTDTMITQDPLFEPAGYHDYTGIKSEAYWHFDQEMAWYWLSRHRAEFAKTSQTITQTAFSCSNPWGLCTPDVSMANTSTVNFGASASSGLPISYQAYYHSVFCPDENSIHPSAARNFIYDSQGREWITIMQKGNVDYRYAETPVRIKVVTKTSGTSQSISAPAIGNKAITDAPFAFNASASSGLEVDEFVETGALTKNENNWVIQDFSTSRSQVHIRYGQAGNATYATAPLVTDFFEITNNRSYQNIVFDSIADQPTTAPAFAVHASGQSSSAPIYMVYSGPASINSSTLTLTGDTGTVCLLATIPGDALYNSVKAVRRFQVRDLVSTSPVLLAESVKVYPNPSRGDITIETQYGTPFSLKVLSADGRVIQSLTNRQTHTNLHIDHPGIYILLVETETQIITEKIVIRKD